MHALYYEPCPLKISVAGDTTVLEGLNDVSTMYSQNEERGKHQSLESQKIWAVQLVGN